MKATEVIDLLKRRFPNEPEYLQAVKEVVESIEDVYNEHPEFEKANPGIKIEWVGLPYGSYKQQLLIMAQAGELPDVLQAERSMFSAFTGPGYLADLGAVLPKDYVADIAPALKDDLTIDGQLYATPWLYSGFVMYYNKDLFPKRGLIPPSRQNPTRKPWLTRKSSPN